MEGPAGQGPSGGVGDADRVGPVCPWAGACPIARRLARTGNVATAALPLVRAAVVDVEAALLDGVRTTAASADRDAHDERPELGDPWVRAINVDPGQQRRIRAIRPRTCAQTTYGGPPW